MVSTIFNSNSRTPAKLQVSGVTLEEDALEIKLKSDEVLVICWWVRPNIDYKSGWTVVWGVSTSVGLYMCCRVFEWVGQHFQICQHVLIAHHRSIAKCLTKHWPMPARYIINIQFGFQILRSWSSRKWYHDGALHCKLQTEKGEKQRQARMGLVPTT